MLRRPSNLKFSAIQATSHRLSWTKLQDSFEGEWIELIDFEWDWRLAHPLWARVRHHASDRNELLSKIEASGKVPGAVVFYIGAHNSFIKVHERGASF